MFCQAKSQQLMVSHTMCSTKSVCCLVWTVSFFLSSSISLLFTPLLIDVYEGKDVLPLSLQEEKCPFTRLGILYALPVVETVILTLLVHTMDAPNTSIASLSHFSLSRDLRLSSLQSSGLKGTRERKQTL